jgi:L-threonylcarbamoyladenylate synthase
VRAAASEGTPAERAARGSSHAAEADVCEAALRRLAAGGLVAFPTETLWALGADATSEASVTLLRDWKGRDAAQPVSVFVEGVAALEALGAELPTAARRLAERLWPGPLTLVLRCPGRFASGVARADGAVGFRCSPHPVAAELVRRSARAGLGPLTATSLNRSGAAPARSRAEAAALCGAEGQEPWLLFAAGPDAGGGAPSSVVDLTGPRPALLREGAVAAAVIEAVAEGRQPAAAEGLAATRPGAPR